MRSRFALIFAASGAAALIYEVTWTRLLTLRLGHGVAAASTVLAAFMGGLAIGSAIGGRRAATFHPAGALRGLCGSRVVDRTVGLAAFPSACWRWIRCWLPRTRMVPVAPPSVHCDWSPVSAFVLPAAAMGATFPIASRWFVQQAGHAARDAGALYASNTVGAAIGALLAGFVLLPSLGSGGHDMGGGCAECDRCFWCWWIAGRLPGGRGHDPGQGQ